jgi:hypothetical protein
MHLRRPSLKVRLLAMLVLVPLIAWFVVKPVRVFAPRLAGVTCVSASVCIDDAARCRRPPPLRGGHGLCAGRAGRFRRQPRMIFCASQACADSFGLGARSAVTIGTRGTVIGPRAWKSFYVRHELIHYSQAEHLGTLSLLFKPQWFVEGMAYALSQDPRAPLAEPFEGYRSRFLAWYGGVGKPSLWQAARAL